MANKFKNLATKLIQNKLWCSKITYIKNEVISNGAMPETIKENSRIEMNVVIKSINNNLIDNVKILNGDCIIVLAATSVIPKIKDKIIIENELWKIVSIKPLGILSNEPTAYELIIRKA